MQVEMQVSTFLVGGLIIYFVAKSDFKTVLLINGALLFLSALMLRFIPYIKQPRPDRAKVAKNVYLAILKRKDLMFLGLADGARFTCVMMLNIIHPIYFSQVLKMDVSSLAMLSISWGIGAALSGFAVSRVISQKSSLFFVKLGTGVYVLALLGITVFPKFPVILVLIGVCGAMGSGTRVAFNTYIMSAVDKNIFGSYLAAVSMTTYLQRTVFGLFLTFIIAGFPASNYYWFALCICGFSFVLLQLHDTVSSSEKLEIINDQSKT